WPTEFGGATEYLLVSSVLYKKTRSLPGSIAMQNGASNTLLGSSLLASFGENDHIGADRACAEFRSGRPVLIRGSDEALLTLPVEGLTAERLAEFITLSAPPALRLAVTARRARALGLDATGPLALTLAQGIGADDILSLVMASQIDGAVAASPAGAAAAA